MRRALLAVLIFSSLCHVTLATVTFKETFRRYLSGHDVFRLWAQKFPKAEFSALDQCHEMTDANRALLGEKNPATGEPTYRTPSAAFIRWYSKCLLQWIAKDINASYPRNMGRFFGQQAIDQIQKAPYSGVLSDAKSIPWATLSDEARAKIIRHLVVEYIGPGIIQEEERFVEHLNGVAKSSYGNLTTFDALKKLLFLIGTQEEFLKF